MSERKELFDDWAATYDEELAGSTGFPFAGYDRVLDEIVGGAEAGKGATVLDVGTGTGALASRFARLGCRALGVDYSEKMLVQARSNVPNAEFNQLDLLGDWGDLKTKRFEAVVSAYVLHEFEPETKYQLLTRLAGLLEPGGRMVIGDISFETVHARAAARQTWAAVWDESEHYWVAEDALPKLAELGLKARYTQVSFCAGVYLLQAG